MQPRGSLSGRPHGSRSSSIRGRQAVPAPAARYGCTHPRTLPLPLPLQQLQHPATGSSSSKRQPAGNSINQQQRQRQQQETATALSHTPACPPPPQPGPPAPAPASLSVSARRRSPTSPTRVPGPAGLPIDLQARPNMPLSRYCICCMPSSEARLLRQGGGQGPKGGDVEKERGSMS